MKTVKKILLIGGISILVIIIALGVAIKMIVTKDFVADIIEKNINGRVEIKDISVPIWAALSGISIDGFKIGNKDAEMKKPMADRSPMKNQVIGFDRFNFKVAIGKLITSGGKNFEMKSMLFSKPVAHIVLFEKGGNNLVPLLIKPKTKEEKEAAKLAEQEAKEKAKEEKAKKKKEPKEAKVADKPFSIKSVPTAIKMSKIGIEDGYFTVDARKSGQKLELSDVDFVVKDISIDPKDLEHKNSVKINAGFTMMLKESKKKGVKSFKIIFDSNAAIQPFQVKTGYVTENLSLRMGLLKGTFFTGLAIFENLKSKTDQLAKIGVKLDFLKDTLELTDDAWMGVHYSGGKVTLTDAPVLTTADMKLTLQKKNYINIKTMKHEFTPTVSLAAKHTETINNQVENALKPVVGALSGQLSKIPGAADKLSAAKLREQLLAPAMENGQFTLVAVSSGLATSPDVKIIKPAFPSLKDLVANEFRKLTGNVKDMISGEINAAKDKAKKMVNAKVDEAKAKAAAEAERAKKEQEERARQQAEEELKKKAKLPF